MNVISTYLRCIPDGVRMGVRLWPWTLLLLAVNLLPSGLAGGAVIGAVPGPAAVLVASACFALTGLATLRFLAAHLDQDMRSVLNDRSQALRFAVWYGFLGLLQLLAQLRGIAGFVPHFAILLCVLGSLYFSLRLIAVLPAVIAWRNWPGIDRIWNDGATIAWQLLRVWLGASLIVTVLIVLLVVSFHPDVPAAMQRGQHFLAARSPAAIAATLGLSVAGVVLELANFAFQVACFRAIATKRP